MKKQCWHNPGHPKIREFLQKQIQLKFRFCGDCHSDKSTATNYSHVQNVHNLCWLLSFILCLCCRVNGSIPSSAEIRDNVLTFKGPVTYDVQGTYVCDATNSIGTRSASVEVSIIGMFTWSLGSFHLRISTKWKERNDLAGISYWLCVCVYFPSRKATTTDRNRWCHQRCCLTTGRWSAHGHNYHGPGAQNKKQKRRLLVRKQSIILLLFCLPCLLKVHYVVLGEDI